MLEPILWIQPQIWTNKYVLDLFYNNNIYRFMVTFDYLVYVILFLIAVALFFHYRERISKKIIMTESYADVDSVVSGQLKKYDLSYNDALKSYDEIAKSYTNMRDQNNKLEPGSLANPSSYDQNFNVLKSKYDVLSKDVTEVKDVIKNNVEKVAANYQTITGYYDSQDQKNYVRSTIDAKKSAKINAVHENSPIEVLKKEMKRQISNFKKRENTNCVSGRIPTGPRTSGTDYKYLGEYDSYEDCLELAAIPDNAQAITWHKNNIPDWKNQCYSINDSNTSVGVDYAICGVKTNDNIIQNTAKTFNAELDNDSSGKYLQTLIKPIYDDGLRKANNMILNMAKESQSLITNKVNAEIGNRKRTLPSDDLSKNNGVVVRVYNKLTAPREKLKEYVIPSINYYTTNADGIFTTTKGGESRILEFITMINIPSGTSNITLNLFTGTSSSLFVNGSNVLPMNSNSSGTERSTNRIQVNPGEKISVKVVAYEGDSTQESYVVLKWKKGTEQYFEIISSNNYFMPTMNIYGSGA
jgi:hypothetical protein